MLSQAEGCATNHRTMLYGRDDSGYNFAMRRIIFLLAGIALLGFAAEDPLVGVWKLNTAKSHFSHGDLPLSLVLTIEADGPDGISYSSKNHLVDGSSGGGGYPGQVAGEEYPFTGTAALHTASIPTGNGTSVHI